MSTHRASRFVSALTVSVVVAAALVAQALPAAAATGLDPIGPGTTNNPAGVQCVQDALRVDRSGGGAGTYGPATRQAVTAFQLAQGMPLVTGIVGPKTGDELVRSGRLPGGCAEHVPTTTPLFGGNAPPPAPVAVTPEIRQTTADRLAGVSVGRMEKRRTLEAPEGAATATCAVAAGLSKIACAVEDTKADKTSAYVEWEAVNGRGGKIKDADGSAPNTIKVKTVDDLAIWVDGSTLRWRVCAAAPTLLRPWVDGNCSKYENLVLAPGGEEIELYCSVKTSASRAASCEYLTHPEGWVLSNQCLPAIGKEVADWATLKAGKAVKLVAKLADSRAGAAGLKVKDGYSGYGVITDCT